VSIVPSGTSPSASVNVEGAKNAPQAEAKRRDATDTVARKDVIAEPLTLG
jgi:hypothetical protein